MRRFAAYSNSLCCGILCYIQTWFRFPLTRSLAGWLAGARRDGHLYTKFRTRTHTHTNTEANNSIRTQAHPIRFEACSKPESSGASLSCSAPALSTELGKPGRGFPLKETDAGAANAPWKIVASPITCSVKFSSR